MKKIRLLQVAVYIVFAALFLKYAVTGFKEGFNDGMENRAKHGDVTRLIQGAVIDARLINSSKNGEMLLSKDYQLERLSINADIRVNAGLMSLPGWLPAADIIITIIIFLLLLRLSITITIIIFNIYTGLVFTRKSVSLFRQTGFLLIVYAAIDYIGQEVTFFKSKSLLNPPVTILNTSHFDFVLLVCALLVLIIAEAFKQGTQLKEEQQLTI